MRSKSGLLLLVAVFLGAGCCWIGCSRRPPTDGGLIGVGLNGTAQQITINFDGTNCTQSSRIIGPFSPGDTVTFAVTGADSVTVNFPQPNVAAGPIALPGSPFLNPVGSVWQYAVSSGMPSKPIALTTREAPSTGDSFWFYYSSILVNGTTPCNLNVQGMGIQVTR